MYVYIAASIDILDFLVLRKVSWQAIEAAQIKVIPAKV